MKKCIVPGSFDPITIGHMGVIRDASEIFDEVIVAVCENTSKKTLLSAQERLILAQDAVKDLPNVSAVVCSGLLYEYALENGIEIIVKGIRNISDYAYEYELCETNKNLASDKYGKDIKTVFIPSRSSHLFISSTMIRELIKHESDFSEYVPNGQLLRKILKKG